MEITGRIPKNLSVKDVKMKTGHTRKLIKFGLREVGSKEWKNFSIFSDFVPEYIAAGKEVTVTYHEDQHNPEYDNYTVDISMVRANGEPAKEEEKGSPTNHNDLPPDPEMEEDFADTRVEILRKHIKMLKEEFDEEKAAQIMQSPTGGSMINNIWG